MAVVGKKFWGKKIVTVYKKYKEIQNFLHTENLILQMYKDTTPWASSLVKISAKVFLRCRL
jgi:hypothetical protein